MKEHFELWHLGSRNLVGTYATEAEALAEVAAMAAHYGPDAVTDFLLGAENARGRSREIASGAALVDRARAATPAG